MKISISKSAKRVLSLVIAFAMLLGSLFVANVGVSISADAETIDYSTLNIQYWDGKSSDSSLEQDTTDGTYLIKNAAELYYVCAVAGDVATATKRYKIDPSVYAFILQPKTTVVDKLGGPEAFINLSSAEETRKLFEETAKTAGVTLADWAATAVFDGDFNGSGVPIYGLYNNAWSGNRSSAALFSAVDGGGTRTSKISTTDVIYDAEGITLENIVIKGGYFKGYQRVAAIAGTSWYHTATSTLQVAGCVNLNTSVVANCYLYGTNKKSDGTFHSTSTAIGEMGILGGSMSNDPFTLNNCLVYGNDSLYHTYDSSGSLTGTTKFNRTFAANVTTDTYATNGISDGIYNSIILDAKVNGFTNADTTYSNVYTNFTPEHSSRVGTGIFTIVDSETTKGATGIQWMPNLDWTTWYAVEGEYPSPIMPDGWTENPTVDAITDFADWFDGGDGTEAKPYIIRTADQLKKMLDADPSSNAIDGTRYYYAVADGVDSIYINNATTHDEAVAIGTSGCYHNWQTAKAFNGDFDGKGVTIYGMISTGTNSGFVTEFGHAASIKNINFLGAYVAGARAAVVTTNCSSWGTTEKYTLKSYITSVSVRESYIAATATSDTAGNYTAAGILAVGTPDHVIVKNCLYDGGSCTLKDGDAENGANTSSSKAGIASFAGSSASTDTTATGGASNEVEVIDCVSIGEYPVSLDSDVWYYRYQADATSGFNFTNTYGVFKINDAYPTHFDKYTKFVGCGHIDTKDEYSIADMPTLGWGAWELVTLDDGRVIPMPKMNVSIVDSFSTQIANQNNGNGANGNGAFYEGTYGMYHTLTGSGTAEDPYIITNAFELARAIASGGTAAGQQLHYSLTQDVDAKGASWINQNAIGNAGITKYTYVPFEGVLDGNGHTVYNVSIGDTSSAGLIPVLNGGTVKNIHLRDAKVASQGNVGAIVGTVIGENSTITNCSAERCVIENASGNSGLYDGDVEPTITNSYYYTSADDYKYYGASGAIDGMPTADYTVATADTAVWYKGSENPRLVCRAKAMTNVDVAGDSDDDYIVTDLTALQNHLLMVDGYENVYGDVSRNGKINISDLAILARHIAGSYNKLPDGFWRNAELGNVVIYYGENDNYDSARKVELYLESVTGQDIKKVVVGSGTNVSWGNTSGGDLYVHQNDIYWDSAADTYYKLNYDETTGAITPETLDTTDHAAEIAKYTLDGKLQIVVGDVTGYGAGLAENQYAVTYNNTNGAVWLQGANFTAVEQAAIEFINGSDPTRSSSVYKTESTKSLDDTDKDYIEYDFNGDGTKEKYYYAWGDEFGGDNIDTSIWYNNRMNTETQYGTAGSYNNVETADLDELGKIYTITEDGELSIKRGVRENALTTDALRTKAESLGYVILKDKSGETTVFNDLIDEDNSDDYVNAGSIATRQSLLFKQGYLEMKGSLPSDGHAFASWWMYGHLGRTNYDYSQSLYDKVFKLNNRAAYSSDADYAAYGYDGTSNSLDSTNLKTFKYQVPSSSFEIDIWELMQHAQNLPTSAYIEIPNGLRGERTKGIFDHEVSLNIHKYYDVGVGTDSVSVIDWANPATALGTIPMAEIQVDKTGWQYSTSVGSQDFGHTKESGTFSSYDSYNYDESYQKLLTANRRYGFYWWTDETNFNFTTYIYDIDGDGTEEGDTDMVKITQTSTMTYDEKADYEAGDISTYNADIITDAKTANQYMYYIFDNIFYSSNEYTASNGAAATMFDLISGGEGTTSLDIDYVRVYQLDGKRDIITSETENFNNGNHFGY